MHCPNFTPVKIRPIATCPATHVLIVFRMLRPASLIGLLVCAVSLLAAPPPEASVSQAKAALAQLPLRFHVVKIKRINVFLAFVGCAMAEHDDMTSLLQRRYKLARIFRGCLGTTE